MEIIQDKNGPEGAKNSSKQNTTAGIQMPANDSYQQSLYIASISKSLGYDGLHSPVTDKQNGIEHTFDFYQPDAEILIKMFQGFDEGQYNLYAHHPSKPILIFDSSTIPCRMDLCECGCGSLLVVDKTVAEHLYDNPYVFIYNDGDLWEYHLHTDGKWVWKRKMPFLIRAMMADPEDHEEEEDMED